MSRSIKQAAWIGMVAVLGWTASGCSLLPREEEALKPPLVKPAQENYRTVNVERGSIIKAVTGSATFESFESDIAQFTGQGGRIQEVLVKSGDKVKKGDPLVQLILDGLDLQLKEQELSLARAKYALRQTRAGGDKEAVHIAELQAEIEGIKYERLLKQFNSKQLRANIDGQVVFAESLKEGDYVEPYQTLVVVADPSRLRLSMRVEDTNALKDVDVGVQTIVKLKDKEMTGTVVQTPSSAPTTLNKELAERYARTLYIDVPDLPAEAGIGTMVDVRIVTQQRDNVLKIPRSGLRSYLGRNFVRVLEEGSRLREIDVEPGLTASTEVEIVQGLEEGQAVVLQ